MKKLREVPGAVADPGGGGGGPAPHYLTSDKTEARRAEKNFFETGHPPYLRVWMTASSPHPPPLI